jgi:glycerol kinase
MWILMYVFSYSVSPAVTNDRSEWRLLPTVVFQEFSNEERCKKAKLMLEGSLKEAGAKLKNGLEDLKSVGKADAAQIIIAFNVECLPK